MDLSPINFDRATDVVSWPGDLATLMIGVSMRQGTSPTALIQSGLAKSGHGVVAPLVARGPMTPINGAFNERVAVRLARWKDR